jgi:predicted enzyme involved in methoxymalonyl-ACP biosynthesis
MISDPKIAMYTFAVSDRFTAYGTVGFVLLKSGSVELFVMSCRVLGLSVAVPFLVSCLKDSKQVDQNPRGIINFTPRNEPCRDLFTKAGFRQKTENEFVLENKGDLTKIDSAIYHVRFIKTASSKGLAA